MALSIKTKEADRLARDAAYARAVSFRADLALLLATPAALLRGEGITAPGHAAGAPLAGDIPP